MAEHRITDLADQLERGEITEAELLDTVQTIVDEAVTGGLDTLNKLRAFDGRPPLTEADLTPTRDPFPWET